jgi:hypothetical protein
MRYIDDGLKQEAFGFAEPTQMVDVFTERGAAIVLATPKFVIQE